MGIATGPSLVTGILKDVGEKDEVKMSQCEKWDMELDIDITILSTILE